MFYFTESILLPTIPMPFNTCLGRSSKKLHDVGKSRKKYGKVIDRAIESLNVLLGFSVGSLRIAFTFFGSGFKPCAVSKSTSCTVSTGDSNDMGLCRYVRYHPFSSSNCHLVHPVSKFVYCGENACFTAFFNSIGSSFEDEELALHQVSVLVAHIQVKLQHRH